MSNLDDNRRNWRNSEDVRIPSNGRNDYRGNYDNGRQGNQWVESRNRFQKDDRRFNGRGYQFRNGGLKRTILAEGTIEIGVRVRILDEFHVLYHDIDTGDNPLVVSRLYRYDRVNQAILDYHVDKMLKEGTIIPIKSPYASPVVLCRKNNGLPPDNPEAYRFAVDYRKLNAVTNYPRYPLPLIDDLIMDITHTAIMSALDLRSGYFQLAVNPSDISKTAFVTKNGTHAFRRMPFGLTGAAPNFQKAIDIILIPVIGKFVNVHMDDVIISSPSFTEHIEHLKEVFRLLQDAGLTLNKDKCKFGCEELKYLDLIINKEGIKTDERKVRVIVEMKPPRNSKEVSKFLGMSQWYAKFIKNDADFASPFIILNENYRNFVGQLRHRKHSTWSMWP
ncbi:retrovirus-related Pol polyprotein from transposon 297 [Trichonephila clavipes]|nr:retrovirus-related Pol polyprotein from transposon 297 [Trichonephila clavipes]